MATGRLEPLFARSRLEPVVKTLRPPCIGGPAGQVTQFAEGQPAPPQRVGQQTAVPGIRVFLDQLLVNGDGSLVIFACLCWSARARTTSPR